MKRLSAMLLSLILLLSLAACGNDNSTPGVESPNDSEEITIYLVHSKQEISEQLDEIIALYESTHPNVHIVAEFLSDYTTTIKTKFNGGDEPDVFTVIGNTDAKLWQDYLEDLSNEVWKDDIIDIARDAVTLDGKLLAFPLAVEGYGYMYNPDLFAKAGIQDVPTTRADFESDVSALKSAGITPLVELYSSYYQLGNFWVNVGFARQDDPMAFIQGLYDGTESFVGNKEFEDLANFLLFDTANCQDAMNTTFSLQVSTFAQQNAAMTLGGNWNEPTLEGADAQFRYGLMPICINDDVEKNDNLFIGVSVYWGINKNSDDRVKAAAKDFFNWLATDEEGQTCLTEKLRLIPAFESVSAEDAQLGYLSQDLVRYMSEGKTLGMYFSYFPDGGPQALGTVTQELVGGQLTVDEYLVKMQDAWDSLL